MRQNPFKSESIMTMLDAIENLHGKYTNIKAALKDTSDVKADLGLSLTNPNFAKQIDFIGKKLLL